MAIDVKDLPPKYQAQVYQKFMEQRARQGSHSSPAADVPEKANKYRNKPTERVADSGKVLRFASQKEARRYDELMIMLQAGKIRDLKLQPQFTLQEAYTTAEGIRVRAIRYHADFTYQEPYTEVIKTPETGGGYMLDTKPAWRLVVEDVKSKATKTSAYAMKKKLMKERFNIDIQEV